MSEIFNTTGRITLAEHLIPKLLYTDGKVYLDFYSIRQLCGGEAIAKTTLFYYIKELPDLDQHMIKYRNRSYYQETFILIQLKNLIFN
jgi:hypothetical protein